ncbi:MAG: DEAD/DEAH box helicase family protein [Rhodospirillales bacterium]|nr:DEAD/DEAH box helicase family protein [Rhodospirillales bacterium]
MNDLIRIATLEITRFLATQLPGMSPNWWQKHVVDRLSFQQQRIVQERGHTSLPQLDLAALLRVLDQNWYELGGKLPLPREARTWLKELQTVRNKWAHMSGEALPPSEVYRDADTLGRVLKILSSEPASLHAVEAAKVAALAAMTGHAANPTTDAGNQQQSKPQTVMSDTAGSEPPPPAPSMFKVGDLIALRSDPGTLLPVIEVISGSVECRYRVFQNNAFATYYESQLQAAPATEDVRHQLSVRELHAHLTSLNVSSPSASNLFSLRLGRVQFIPYQYRPVLKLIRADRPRLLIADEVGVGKTIEAGLIIQELRARMDIASVLVICPKALVAERKWFTEMKRFDESFTALDGKLLRHCLRETHLEGEWPEKYSKAILPFSLFDSDLLFGRDRRGKKTDQGLLDLDPPPKFDLVIVDEAHHLRNTETLQHQGVRFFCDNASAVLLLTATPVQLGSQDLFTLLNVLRPDLVIDPPSFDQMAEPNRHINTAIQHCRAGRPLWQQEARACLDAIANTSWGQLFLRESPAFQSVYDRLGEDGLTDTDRVKLIRAIEDLYTFGSLINRTRRRDIGEFTSRKPETLTVEFTEDQRRLHDDLLDVIARILTRCHGQQNVKFLMTTIRRQAASCLYGLAPLLSDILTGKLDRLEVMEAGDSDDETDLTFVDQVRADIEDILERARNLDARDPKVEAFLKVLIDKDKRPNNKALVFSTFRHTLSYLDAHARRAGIRVGLVHGDVPDEDRADLRRRFALPREDGNAIDVLLSSEVGCEGLDFQFCDLLVNYDLPWNPMRIEQRIGRIDRFGQQSVTVAIVNLITPGTVDAAIYDRCLWRIGVFQHAVGGSEEILGKITSELHDIAESFTLSEDERAQRLQQLSDNAIRIIQEEQELETRQSELFGLSVPNQSWSDEFEAAESFWLSPASLQGCVTAYLAARLDSEGSHVLGDKPLKTLRLSQEARDLLLADFKRLPRSLDPIARAWEKWLKGDKPTLSITFDQQAAVENPKVVHLSVVHPLVRQAARHLEISEPKHVALEAVHPDIPAGTHPFALYRWSKHGVKQDEVLIAVADDAHVEPALLQLLQTASDASSEHLLDSAQCEALEARHYEKWSTARADHIAENRQLVDQRIQSLTVSHQARCQAIQDQIMRATNDKIRLMKQSELLRANADFDRRVVELQQAADSGDIRATPVVFGTLSVSET